MQIEIFKYKSDEEQVFNDVRTVEDNGEIWFWATDVARVLGYSNAHDAILKHCKSKGGRDSRGPCFRTKTICQIY